MTTINFYAESSRRQFIENLKAELLNLPGAEAHLMLAPEIRKPDIKIGRQPVDAIESAVLILLYPIENNLHTAVILRNEYDGVHSGQISLPGGKAEETDADFMVTALREAEEEIGIDPSEVEVIGQLSRFYVQPSNFIIYPFVAFQAVRPHFLPDSTEVQRVIEIDIFNDLNFNKVGTRTLKFKNNIQVNAPGFTVDNEFLWGATAMILSELMYILLRMNK